MKAVNNKAVNNEAGSDAAAQSAAGKTAPGESDVALLAVAQAWREQDPDDETRAELGALIDDVLASGRTSAEAAASGTAPAETAASGTTSTEAAASGTAPADAAASGTAAAEAPAAGSLAAAHTDSAAAQALETLRQRFDGRLKFGTAGLRGEIAAGPTRMNRAVVGQAAAGLAAYLVQKAQPGVTPSVVIGYDGRKNSAVFARDSAELMAGAGIRAVLLPRLLPTPLVAFAVRHLGVSAGIMVTASHNPPNDNGYKVYLGGADEGAQIVTPADEEIEAEIVRVATTLKVTELPRSTHYETAPESLIEAYITETARVGWLPPAEIGAQPRVVYTAMHGVGWHTFSRVLGAAGFIEPDVVTAQLQPDPRFPTVAFPNPEEPGALDLAYETARSAGAQLIMANDPDADRLAIAIPDASSASGYRRLTGNQVGALLGWRAAEAAARGSATSADAPPTLACSVVSSPALAAVAAAYGLRFRETLTGFKWVSRVPGLIFGYEEALGYLVNPTTLRDKDGISAAVAFLSLASDLAVDGYTIADQLDRFSEKFGHFDSAQISLRVTDLARIDEIMASLRRTPPRLIGGLTVASIDDLSAGSAELPASDILRIRTSDGSRIMVRPSGTEPKLKVYIDVSSTEGSVKKRKKSVATRLQALETGMRELVA
ncbi:phospho-sugar mutase [Subtercola lobariae]|nr:phospho-sugar mutase [Subtercola lobariae]